MWQNSALAIHNSHFSFGLLTLALAPTEEERESARRPLA
jgi:hypothetical protein